MVDILIRLCHNIGNVTGNDTEIPFLLLIREY
jgi:hypothetical protein